MATTVLILFIFVYLAMILGGIPGLKLDRTGAALVGAIGMLAAGAMTLDEAWHSVHVPTIALLLGMMVISAQFRLAGFYSALTRRLAAARVSPPALLFLLIFTAGMLSAVLANDIVCLAMTGVLLEGCVRRGLNPMPYLLGLACASNVGSAATLIGNPQNMLIGQTMNLDFADYLLDGGVPAILGLLATWTVIAWIYRGGWLKPGTMPSVDSPPLDRYQAAKGLIVVLILVSLFLFSSWPRELIALGAAGILLMSRRMASPRMLGLVDWQLLVLFVALFVVNHGLAEAGWFDAAMEQLTQSGMTPGEPVMLFILTAALSNLVSNVPAVMLLLPVADGPMAGPLLALSSTLAGNLILVGSIANIIVVIQARAMGFGISWKQHARVGVPITLITLAIAAAWLALRWPG
ncbi:MAG: anion transporter [Phycisphaeraceae bacterium]|nr:anion transporter [Phycisphaeraceae bacterium]